MSVKLLVLYPTPTDPEQFDRRYEREHLAMGKATLIGATGLASHSRVARGQVSVRSTDGGVFSHTESRTRVRGPVGRPEDPGTRGRDFDRRCASLHDRGGGGLRLTRRNQRSSREGVGAHPSMTAKQDPFREGGKQDTGEWRPVALSAAKRRK
jgi:hypothetical protein